MERMTDPMQSTRTVSTGRGDVLALGAFFCPDRLRRFKANLHCHSTHSDGRLSPEEIAVLYREAGYEVLCIADHNTYADQDGDGQYDWNLDGIVSSAFRPIGEGPKPHLPCKEDAGREAYVRDYTRSAAEQGRPWVEENWKLDEPGRFVVLPGFEDHLTGPHIVVNGFPVEQGHGDIAAFKGTTGYREPTQRAGGVVYLAHPHGVNDCPSFFLDDPERRQFDGIEVVNSFLMRQQGSDDPAGARGFARQLWDAVLTERVSCWGYGNDDSHNRDMDSHAGPFGAWTDVWAESLTAEAVLRALRMGSCCASNGVTVSSMELVDATLCVSTENASHIRFIGSHGRTLMEADSREAGYAIQGDEVYIRIECESDERRWPSVQPDLTSKAFCQPVWVLRDGDALPEGFPAGVAGRHVV